MTVNRKFSERYGYIPVRQAIQLDSMDAVLRTSLWNIFKLRILDGVGSSRSTERLHQRDSNALANRLFTRIWLRHFSRPLDELDMGWRYVYENLYEHFFRCPWYEVYDLIEFVAISYDENQFKHNFIAACNSMLVLHSSAYRFVDGRITQLTERHEIESVEDACNVAAGQASTHIRRALRLLTDREHPDYRNSIKESISAVESLVKHKLKTDKGTLGDLLKKLQGSQSLHPSLAGGIGKIYGYTNDAHGIRHGLTDKEEVTSDDAKFLLVVCSALVNFIAPMEL